MHSNNYVHAIQSALNNSIENIDQDKRVYFFSLDRVELRIAKECKARNETLQ